MLQRLDHLLTVASRYGVGARSLEVDPGQACAMVAGVAHANLLVMLEGKPVVALTHPEWYDAAREIINLVMVIRGEFEDDE
jgi:hypothetical protein